MRGSGAMNLVQAALLIVCLSLSLIVHPSKAYLAGDWIGHRRRGGTAACPAESRIGPFKGAANVAGGLRAQIQQAAAEGAATLVVEQGSITTSDGEQQQEEQGEQGLEWISTLVLEGDGVGRRFKGDLGAYELQGDEKNSGIGRPTYRQRGGGGVIYYLEGNWVVGSVPGAFENVSFFAQSEAMRPEEVTILSPPSLHIPCHSPPNYTSPCPSHHLVDPDKSHQRACTPRLLDQP